MNKAKLEWDLSYSYFLKQFILLSVEKQKEKES